MPDKNKPIQKSLINFKNGLQNRRLFDILDKQHLCGSDSVVECHLAKVEVAGPNPVSRSREVEWINVSYPRDLAPTEHPWIVQTIHEYPLQRGRGD